jgi:cell filamentation protein
MNRYRIAGSEAECEPGSNGLVLRNLLSITDPEEMANVEQGLLRQLYEAVLTDSSSHGRLTTRMLMAWHCRWLGNVYVWAGAERTVNVSKDGFAFATAVFIPDLLREFQRQQLDVLTPCRPTSVDELLYALSSVHVELILIHPFREGNGRIARLLCDVMAVQAEVGPLGLQRMGSAT